MRIPTHLQRVVVSAAALMLSIGAWAEVSVIDPGTGPKLPGILEAIEDTVNPFEYVWKRYRYRTEVHVLNEEGFDNDDGPPSIAIHPITGIPIVAWARNSPTGYDIVLSSYDAGWTSQTVVAASSLDELDPSLVIDSTTGDVHLFWWVNDVTPTVMHSVAPQDLSSWSVPNVVSSPSEASLRPFGAMHNGSLYVAYEVHDYGYGATPRQIVLSQDVEGTFIPQVVTISNYEGAISAQVHSSNGKLWVDWIDSDQEAAWSRMGSGGQWEPVQTMPYADEMELRYHVRGAIKQIAQQP